MSEQDRSRERDHWQAIAEQLGLAPERESAASELPAVRKPAPEPTPQRLEAPAKEAAQAGLVAEESAITRTEPERVIPEKPAAQAAPDDADETAVEQEPGQPELEQRPRRRGRRRRRPEEDAPPVEVAASQSGEEAEDQQGNRRRRGRRKKAETAAELPEVHEEAVAVEPDKDEEMDDLGDFSEWNVPSWNELIASLYRPGR